MFLRRPLVLAAGLGLLGAGALLGILGQLKFRWAIPLFFLLPLYACWRLDRLGRNLKHLITLLDELQALGVAFISLAEAMQDDAYARPDTFAGSGGSWLSRSATAMGKKIESTAPPRVPAWIIETR